LKTSNKIYITTLITYLVAAIFFSLDQYTKKLITVAMPITVDVANRTTSGYPPYKFTEWLWFTHVVNFGAAFSTFYGQKLLLSIFAVAISLGIILYERFSNTYRTKLLSFSLGFLLAGALGNLTDRLRFGYVTDFLDLRHNSQNIWPIFNVADISINIGIGLLILFYLFQDKKSENKQDFEDDEIPENNNLNTSDDNPSVVSDQ
jgi:signal peptidase II